MHTQTKEIDPIKETESSGTIPDPQPETIIDSDIQNAIAPLKD